jgi:hypothetical protein
MAIFRQLICIISITLLHNLAFAQVVINEGSNRNYSSISDEDGDFPDWVELYNPGYDTVSLLNYSISDKPGNPTKWIFPDVKLAPGQYKTIFCSDKDRNPVSGFINVINTGNYTPVTGWNTHEFTTPFYWDGISNILVNSCSYSSNGYTTNSVFNQTFTPFVSTVFTFQDGSPSACSQNYGSEVSLRPDMKFNGFTVGSAEVQNSPYDYPAPYGNWYWCAKNQMLVHATELSAAGLTAGFITNIAFSVVSTDPNTHYDYIDISMKLTSADAVTSHFETVDPNNNLHTQTLKFPVREKPFHYTRLNRLRSAVCLLIATDSITAGAHSPMLQLMFHFSAGQLLQLPTTNHPHSATIYYLRFFQLLQEYTIQHSRLASAIQTEVIPIFNLLPMATILRLLPLFTTEIQFPLILQPY